MQDKCLNDMQDFYILTLNFQKTNTRHLSIRIVEIQ